MLMSVLITALFVTGVVFAGLTIASTLRAYLPAVAALRDVAKTGGEVQDVRTVSVTYDVVSTARVLRPAFNGRFADRPAGMRAAA